MYGILTEYRPLSSDGCEISLPRLPSIVTSTFLLGVTNLLTIDSRATSRKLHQTHNNLEIMSKTTTIDFSNIAIAVDPFQSDDLSILSFGDPTNEGLDELNGSHNLSFELLETKTPASRYVPVSDDESISGASLFSDISLHSLRKSPKACEESHPSIEEMIVKLNRSMIRSARTRAMVFTTVFPDLKKQVLQRNKKQILSASISPIVRKSSVHMAQRSTAKHTYSNSNHGIAKSSLLQFLRATKKW